MKAKFWITASLALALSACGAGNNDRMVGGLAPPPPPAPAMAPAMEMSMDAASSMKMASGRAMTRQIDQPEQQGGGGPAATDNRQIAYTYSRTLRAPTTRMQELMNAHKAACDAAGSAKCYVSNSNISGLGTENTEGQLELHAAPDWMKTFLDGLPESLKPFEAVVDASNTASEDLTVQIVDTSARLNSSKMLRERLNALLKDRPGKLSDLLDIERELARVQAEIDSTESVIAALKARVGMSTLTLSYQPKLSAVSRTIWEPLGDAFEGFLPNLVSSLAGVINFISSMLLWIIFLGAVIWFAASRWRRGRAKRANSVPPASPAGPEPAGT